MWVPIVCAPSILLSIFDQTKSNQDVSAVTRMLRTYYQLITERRRI